MHAGQLDAQGKANVELKQQNAELRKEMASHQEELQIASAKLVSRCYCCLPVHKAFLHTARGHFVTGTKHGVAGWM